MPQVSNPGRADIAVAAGGDAAAPYQTLNATASASGPLSTAWNGTGTAPANSQVELDVSLMASVSLQLVGTASLTAVFEGTVNGTDWVAVIGYTNATHVLATSLVATTTVNSQFTVDVVGFWRFRVRCSAFTSGQLSASIMASPVPCAVGLVNLRSTLGVTPLIGNATDANVSTTTAGVQVLAAQYLRSSTTGLEQQRVPSSLRNLAAQAVTAGTAVLVYTPAAGKKFRLLSYHLSLSVAGSVIFREGANAGASTEFLRTPLLAAGIGQPAPGMGNGFLSAAANNVLAIDATASGTISGWLGLLEE